MQIRYLLSLIYDYIYYEQEPGCDYFTLYESELREHMRRHGIGILSCDLCDKKYKTHASLRYHKLTVHEGKEKKNKNILDPQMCEECGKTMCNKSSLKVSLEAKLKLFDKYDIVMFLAQVQKKHWLIKSKDMSVDTQIG